METWKTIPEWPNYEVSSLGQIRRAETKCLLKLAYTPRGYLFVLLYRGGKKFNVKVATAVAQAFIGPRPAGLTVNHVDEIKGNNTPENLEYCTLYENNKHATRMGLRPTGDKNGMRIHPERIPRGSRNGRSKFNEEEIPNIRRLRAEGHSIASLSRDFGVAHSTISRILRGLTWRHIA